MASTEGDAPEPKRDGVMADAPRRRGRPPKREGGAGAEQAELSRDVIIEHAVRLSREVSLDDISIVQVAKDLAVTPATIHYHLTHGRDELLSEVVTIYMRNILYCFEKVEGSWEERLRTVAARLFRVHIEFKGVNAYLMKHNKFRLLQTASRNEQDLGVRYLDRFILLFQEHGFDIETCVINVHQLAFFIASCAQAEIGRQFPAYHQKYLKQELSSQRLQAAPHFAEALDHFMQFDADKMFLTGIDIMLRGFAVPGKKEKNISKKKPSTR
ncbi:MAG: TetR/AcrR family transcriptional regulator C-terminal domain-containing protein [Pseudomonadota bacterium]